MIGFDAMSDGELTLCANLLRASAREQEKIATQSPCRAFHRYPAAQRALALRLENEVDQRSAACCLTKETT